MMIRNYCTICLALCVLTYSTSCRTTRDADLTSEQLALAESFPSAQSWKIVKGQQTLISAHRAQPELPGVPENSLLGINELCERGQFILEIDVAMSLDSVLYLFHDDSLHRLTRNQGLAQDFTWALLDTMRLRDSDGGLTAETIPTLNEALHAAHNRALLMLDRKGNVSYAMLMSALREANMQDVAALILYDADDYTEWTQLPEVGPISFGARSASELSAFAKTSQDLYRLRGLEAFKKADIKSDMLFAGVGTPREDLLNQARALGITTIAATFGEIDDRAARDGGAAYRKFAAKGIDIIATNRPLAAATAFNKN